MEQGLNAHEIEFAVLELHEHALRDIVLLPSVGNMEHDQKANDAENEALQVCGIQHPNCERVYYGREKKSSHITVHITQMSAAYGLSLLVLKDIQQRQKETELKLRQVELVNLGRTRGIRKVGHTDPKAVATASDARVWAWGVGEASAHRT